MMTNKTTSNSNPEPVDLSEEGLMATAQRQTGLSDWGDLDFIAGMRVLLAACKQEADLSLLGQQWLQRECIKWLSNRLRIQETLNSHPACFSHPIRRPLFMATLPRTGSTFLHRLLAQDGGARIPLYWELQQPAPPPQADTYMSDPRIAQAKEEARREQMLFPESSIMHFFNATSPEECGYLLRNSFASFDTTFWYHVPSYHKWLCESDLTNTYRYYKKQLQILSWGCPGEPWVLKNPSHLLDLDALLTVFPDACVVQLHRSPYQQIASLCSTQGRFQNSLRNTPMAPNYIGQLVLNRWSLPLKKAMEVRSRANKAPFYDIHYQDLLADPIATVSQLYDYFDYDLNSETLVQMQQWLNDNPQHKHGKHSYTLEAFGLSPALIDEQFNDYIKQYNVRL
jgi:hypothetical protein